MSTRAERSQPDSVPPYRLQYLLKHASLRLADLTDPALAPYGVDPRELAVLAVVDELDQPSQQEVAGRLRIDRTTMVALVDELEHKGMVARHPHPDDRRKNAIELSAAGRKAYRGAARAVDKAEAQFLAPLSTADAEELRNVLRELL